MGWHFREISLMWKLFNCVYNGYLIRNYCFSRNIATSDFELYHSFASCYYYEKWPYRNHCNVIRLLLTKHAFINYLKDIALWLQRPLISNLWTISANWSIKNSRLVFPTYHLFHLPVSLCFRVMPFQSWGVLSETPFTYSSSTSFHLLTLQILNLVRL